MRTKALLTYAEKENAPAMSDKCIKWNNCEKCGKQFGLHPSDDHDFVGLPYDGYDDEATKPHQP